MKREFFEPEVEVVEFEVSDGDPENPVEPDPSWGF